MLLRIKFFKYLTDQLSLLEMDIEYPQHGSHKLHTFVGDNTIALSFKQTIYAQIPSKLKTI